MQLGVGLGPMSKKLLREAVRFYGSQDKLAVAIRCSQMAICHALRTGRISPLMAYRIHAATNGEINCVELCPMLDQRRQLAIARKKVNGKAMQRFQARPFNARSSR